MTVSARGRALSKAADAARLAGTGARFAESGRAAAQVTRRYQANAAADPVAAELWGRIAEAQETAVLAYELQAAAAAELAARYRAKAGVTALSLESCSHTGRDSQPAFDRHRDQCLIM